MIEIENRRLASPKFWNAFGSLMAIPELDIESKLELVKLRTTLDNEIVALREVVKGASTEHQEELLTKYTSTDVEQITIKMDKLTAEELFQLQGIYKENV